MRESLVTRYSIWAFDVCIFAVVCALCLAPQAFAGTDGNLAAGVRTLDSTTTGDPGSGDTGSGDPSQLKPGDTAPKLFTGKGMYVIALKSNAKRVIGTKKNDRTNDALVAVATKKNTNLVKFSLIPAGAGQYYVKNVATGRFLCGYTDDKITNKVFMNIGEEKKYQKWKIEVNGDKSVSFTNTASKLRLNVHGGKSSAGTLLGLSSAANTSAQKFNLVRTKNNKKEIVKLKVPCYKQNPQLPTGCESVALTNALRYWGFKLAKTTIAKKYMPYGGNGVYNFIGSPYNSSGWIICAPGIKKTALKYLDKQDSDLEVKVVKGKSLKSLHKYLDQGCPVVVWTTIGMGSPGGVQAVKSGYPLRSNNHAVVLSGYNPKNGKYLVSDSLAGKVWRGGKAFTRLFNAMGKQGVVLYD